MKTKIFTLLLAVAASVGTMFADGTKIGDLYYNLNATDQTAEVSYELRYNENNYKGLTTANIPASVTYSGTTYSVTSIGEAAFFQCTGLTSVTIPSSVTSIGWNAFDGCTGLTSVTIPSSVTSIGGSAFWGCSSLTSVTIPNSVTSIVRSAFSGCSGLTTISVEVGNTIYDSRDNCNAIIETASNTLIAGCKNTMIPHSVTSIGVCAFYGCSSLTSVTIPNSVTSIGDGAFYNCSSLTSVTIGNSVTSIGEAAFEYCSGLTSVTLNSNAIVSREYNIGNIFGSQVTEYIIGEGVTSIGNSAFSGCTGLTSVTIPNSVTSIGNQAFQSCTGLTSVTIPNSVTSIGDWAFTNCSGLTSVTIPNSVTSIGGRAFERCSSLTSVESPAIFFNEASGIFYLAINEMPSQIKYLTINAGTLTEEGFDRIRASYRNMESVDLANAENTELSDEAFKGCYNLQTLRLPAGLKEIRYMAVAECVKLQAIDIPATVESIGDRAFEDCRSMATVTFAGNAIQSIGSWAFYNCHALQNIVIPEGVTEIGDGAFYGCTYLADVLVPASARIIGDNAFALCSKMAQLTVNAVEPPVISSKTFDEVSREMPVYVPNASVAAYKSDPLWGQMNIIGCVTAVEAVGIAPSATKFLRNSEVLILRDGKTYSVQGQEVK